MTRFTLGQVCAGAGLGLLVAASLLPAVRAAHAQDLDLTLEYRTVTAGHDGVTRSSEYVERFTRRASRVWAEKVMPAGVPRDDHDSAAKGRGAHHKHFDMARAARSVERLPDGRVIFTMVNVADRLIVDVAPPEHSTVGFDGSWEQTYYLVSPATLRQMRQVGPGEVPGTLRYELSSNSGTTRVLWDERLKFPLEVASITKDGRTRQSMVARIARPAATLPWSGSERFDRRSLADFAD